MGKLGGQHVSTLRDESNRAGAQLDGGMPCAEGSNRHYAAGMNAGIHYAAACNGAGHLIAIGGQAGLA